MKALTHIFIDEMVIEQLPFGLGGAGDQKYEQGLPDSGKKMTQIISTQ